MFKTLIPYYEYLQDYDSEEYLPPYVLNQCRTKLVAQFPSIDGIIKANEVNQIVVVNRVYCYLYY